MQALFHKWLKETFSYNDISIPCPNSKRIKARNHKEIFIPVAVAHRSKLRIRGQNLAARFTSASEFFWTFRAPY